MRLIVLFPFLLFFGISQFCNAQTCTPLYKHIYGGAGSDEALAIISTSDKGSLVTGRTTSASSGNYDGFAMKLSETGEIQWSRNYGGTAYDELNKVIVVPGGYIISGQSASFGNTGTEPFLMKIDLLGNVLWSRKYVSTNISRHRCRDLIQLNDGNLAILINTNDSTTAGDASVLKLNANGNIIWAKSFDNGGDDAFNSIVQENDSLVVGGHFTKNNLRYGAILKMNIANGDLYYSLSLQKYTQALQENEIFMVSTMEDGIKVASGFRYREGGSTMTWGLVLLKMKNNGVRTFERFYSVSTPSGYTQELAIAKAGTKNSFMFLINDTTPGGYPGFGRVGGETDQMQQGRRLHEDYQYTRVYGMDTTLNAGFIFAGYFRPTYPVVSNKVRVYKLDELLLNGNCNTPEGSSFSDTVHQIIKSFTWQSVSTPTGIVETDISLITSNNLFVRTEVCANTYCEPIAVFPAECQSTLSVNMQGKGWIEIRDARKADDGGYLTVGQYSSGSIQPYIAKLRPNGSIEWAKQYGNNNETGFFNRIIRTRDGSSLAIGINSGVLDHFAYGYSTLTKLDDNGTVIWSKKFSFEGDFDINEVINTDDGGFIFTANYGYGFGYLYNYICRLNSTGDIVWQKQITTKTGGVVYKHLLLENDDLYVMIDYYMTAPIFRVEKWNAQTGQFLWQRSIEPGNADAMTVDHIYKIQDTLFAFINTIKQDFIWAKNNIRCVKLSTSGTLYESFKITQPEKISNWSASWGEHNPNYTLKTPDNMFVVVTESKENNLPFITITKLTPGGTVLWAKKYTGLNKHTIQGIKNDDDNILIYGTINISDYTDPRQDRSFFMKVNRNGEIRENVTGNCQTESITTTTENFTPQIDNYSGTGDIATTNDIVATNYSNLVLPISVYSTLLCSMSDVCNNITINGETTICNMNVDYLYTAKRNTGCSTPVSWQFDVSSVLPIAETDSSITVRFLHPELSTLLKANLSSGCTGVSSEISIRVNRSATDLALGMDTTLCQGNSIILDAGTGYDHYSWQDGSTDSQLSVSQPGTYSITVTDGCGISNTDEIVVSPAPAVVLSLGPDISVCKGDSLKIEAPAGFISYSWSPGYYITSTTTQSTIVFPGIDTEYKLVVEREKGCFGADSIRVIVKNVPTINLGTDTSFCAGNSILLNPGNGFASYQWNNGAATPTIKIDDAGTYAVEVTDVNGCHSADTLNVIKTFPLPVVHLDPKTYLCEGTSRVLDAGPNGVSYLWNNGSTYQTISVGTVGEYSVLVTNANGCEGRDTAIISSTKSSPKNFLFKDTAICSYGDLLLKANANYSSYQWSTGAGSPSITINQPGLYWLKVTDAYACTGADTILVKSKQCMLGVFVPSAFSPNKDGHNDLFKPIVMGNPTLYKFTVFDRWGNIVFQSSDATKGWDGSYKGISSGSNVFIWMCSYQFPGQPTEQQKGTVTLVL